VVDRGKRRGLFEVLVGWEKRRRFVTPDAVRVCEGSKHLKMRGAYDA
jgi:hypothetical protein